MRNFLRNGRVKVNLCLSSLFFYLPGIALISGNRDNKNFIFGIFQIFSVNFVTVDSVGDADRVNKQRIVCRATTIIYYYLTRPSKSLFSPISKKFDAILSKFEDFLFLTLSLTY